MTFIQTEENLNDENLETQSNNLNEIENRIVKILNEK